MGKDFHNDPLFKVLKDYFRVNLFYKPSMVDLDVRYHVVLDNEIIIQFQVIAKNFLIIDNIVPMTTQYIPKTYDNLVKCLINQKEFSVMIFRLGNTTVINDACVNNNVPIVIDDKFITIPKKLYSMYQRLYQKNEDMCGFYLLALNGDLDSIEIITPHESKKPEVHPKIEAPKKPVVKEVKKEPEIVGKPVEPVENVSNNAIDIIKKRLITLFPSSKVCDDDSDRGIILITKDFVVQFHLNGIILELVDMRQVDDTTLISGVTYMNFFAILEGLLSVVPISIVNVKSKILSTICQTRGYERLVGTYSLNRNEYGSYSMKSQKI